MWINKINATTIRDKKNLIVLQNDGWKVKNNWGCELKSMNVHSAFVDLLLLLS